MKRLHSNFQKRKSKIFGILNFRENGEKIVLLTLERDDLKIKKEDAQDHTSELQVHIQVLESKISHFTKTLENNEKHEKALEKEINKLQEQFEKQKASYQEELDKLNSKISQKDLAQSILGAKYNDLKALTHSNLQGSQLGNLQRKSMDNDSKANMFSSVISEEYGELEISKNELEEDLLSDVASAIEDDSFDLEDQNKTRQMQMSPLTVELKEIKEQLQEEKNAHEKTKKMIGILQNKIMATIEQNAETINELTRKLKQSMNRSSKMEELLKFYNNEKKENEEISKNEILNNE